jgi:hypothetical protein
MCVCTIAAQIRLNKYKHIYMDESMHIAVAHVYGDNSMCMTGDDI